MITDFALCVIAFCTLLQTWLQVMYARGPDPRDDR